jgi:hypothetical protein
MRSHFGVHGLVSLKDCVIRAISGNIQCATESIGDEIRAYMELLWHMIAFRAMFS